MLKTAFSDRHPKGEDIIMDKREEKKKYYVVRERAVPEVLLRVVNAQKLLDSGKALTVQEAADQTGISRR